MRVPMTPLEFRARAERLFGRKVGVVDGARRFTYQEFGDRSRRLAAALRGLGCRPGAVVSYLTPNTHHLLEAYYGILQAGCVLAPLNIRLHPQEIRAILAHAGTEVLVFHDEFRPVVDALRHDQGTVRELVVLEPRGPLPFPAQEYEALLASVPPEPADPEVDEDALAELFYTSGTTGRPKGVMLTHRNLYLHTLYVLVAQRYSDRTVLLHVVPLFHVNGWGSPHMVTAVGGTHVMLRKFDPREVFRLIEAERVTVILGVPTVYTALVHHPEADSFDLRSLEVAVTGGAPASAALIGAIEERLGCQAYVGYGLTETCPVLALACPKAHLDHEPEDRRRARRAMTGYGVLGVDLRVVDERGQDVPADGATVGEIVVRSNVVMAGYYKDSEATSAAIRDGWFYAGDMATLDEEGYLDIVDRRKDLIISGGENISSVEVESQAFTDPARADLVTVGNVEDHLDRVRDADWVIEAVVEDLAVKRAVLAQVERHWAPGTVVSTNTSGLSIAAMVEGRSEGFRQHFLGTHFFNPPRLMKLVEVVPGPTTLPEVLESVQRVLARALGKGVVVAKDTPNFIANRIGAYTSCLAMKLALAGGYTVEEVDELTGPLIGRPRTGTFRLADLVGLDTAYHVRRHVYESLPDDPEREVFDPPAPLRALVERGWLGDKSGRGFYWNQGPQTLVVDLATLEYRPLRPPEFATVDTLRGIADLGDRLRALLQAGGRAGAYVGALLARTLGYAARVLPEISEDIVNVDQAMRWGFNWELGPFEPWDRVGVAEVTSLLDREGVEVPEVVRHVLRRPEGRFYTAERGRRLFFDIRSSQHRPVPLDPGILALADLREGGRVILRGREASVVDLGDGVACLDLHGPGGTLTAGTVEVVDSALQWAEREAEALVIASSGRHFSMGLDLGWVLRHADEGRWQDLDRWVQLLQRALQRIRRASLPVVAAPAGQAWGAGFSLCLSCDRVQAAPEVSLGWVEARAGLVPVGGGLAVLLRRVHSHVPEDVELDLFPWLRGLFEMVLEARVSRSADHARRLGYLRESDGVTMKSDYLVRDAKDVAMVLARSGYRPSPPLPLRVGGERLRAALLSLVYTRRVAGHLAPDLEGLARRLAHLVSGGEVPEGSRVSEDSLLDLEREAFLGLLGERATRERLRRVVEGRS